MWGVGLMVETTNAKIKVTHIDGTTAEDITVICGFCGYPKSACTCGTTATVY